MTIRAFHKWLSLAIALQIFIWVGSGTIISLLDKNIVSGGTSKGAAATRQQIGESGPLFPLHELNLSSNENIHSITLSKLDSNLIYRLKIESEERLFDAHTGLPVNITKDTATRNAQASYNGNGTHLTTDLLPDGTNELRKKESVWRVQFDDDLYTRVYVSATDGRVLEHRNRYWKVVDFLLMLHFMDYAKEHSFNNIQIILISFAALWLALSGLLLVKMNFSRRDFSWRGITR